MYFGGSAIQIPARFAEVESRQPQQNPAALEKRLRNVVLCGCKFILSNSICGKVKAKTEVDQIAYSSARVYTDMAVESQ